MLAQVETFESLGAMATKTIEAEFDGRDSAAAMIAASASSDETH